MDNNTLLYSLWHARKQPPNVILWNFLQCLKHMLCQFTKIARWRLVRPYTSSHLIPDMLYVYKLEERAGQDPYIPEDVSGVNRSVETCITLLEYAIW